MTTETTDVARFESEVIPILDPLYRQAVRMTSSQSDAEDLLQETMLKAYAAMHSFRPATNFKAWLSRIMTNTYIDGYRKVKRQPSQHPTDQITDRQLMANAAHCQTGLPSAEDRALEMLPDPQINAALMTLPEQYRTAVYFADVAGFSYKEIAEITGAQQGIVSSRLNRGRRQLRSLLIDVGNQSHLRERSSASTTTTCRTSAG
jgi:RNA polymerase sigma-70 factor (ECF subfamily)